MVKNKISIDGPKLTEFDIEAFKKGANNEINYSLPVTHKTNMWDNARIDVIKPFNLRMPEEYYIKLNYLSKKKRISKNKICLEAVISEIERMLEET